MEKVLSAQVRKVYIIQKMNSDFSFLISHQILYLLKYSHIFTIIC